MDLATRWSNLFVGMSPASFFNFSFLPKYGVYFLQALGYTLLLAVISVLLAVIPALLLAFMRLSKNKFVRGISGAYIAIFRSTPLLVQLSIIYFGFFWRDLHPAPVHLRLYRHFPLHPRRCGPRAQQLGLRCRDLPCGHPCRRRGPD